MKTLAFAFTLLIGIVSATGQNYSIDWYKITGGGGTSSNGQNSVIGAIGQPDASGAMIGGNFSVTGGFWTFVNIVQTPGAPELTILHSGNNVKISWPYPASGWTLQQNSDLNTTNWSARSGVSNDGTNSFITISPPSGILFFRLKSP